MNDDGKMEFPRDLMVEDCLENAAEPLFGFVTNVTLANDQPCIQDVECSENGTLIDSGDDILSDIDDVPLDIDEEKGFDESPTPSPTNIEMSSISDHDLAHRIASIEMPNTEKIKLQMFTENEGISKPNNTKSRPLKSRGWSSNFLLKGMLFGNTTIGKNDNDPVLRDSRNALADSEPSRDMDYVFGSKYLTTYQNKGPYQVKSIVPRLPWDQPPLSIAQDRSDVNYYGNSDHGYFYAYKYVYYRWIYIYIYM